MAPPHSLPVSPYKLIFETDVSCYLDFLLIPFPALVDRDGCDDAIALLCRYVIILCSFLSIIYYLHFSVILPPFSLYF